MVKDSIVLDGQTYINLSFLQDLQAKLNEVLGFKETVLTSAPIPAIVTPRRGRPRKKPRQEMYGTSRSDLGEMAMMNKNLVLKKRKPGRPRKVHANGVK